jgi:oligosaccharide reducing-end xylanase
VVTITVAANQPSVITITSPSPNSTVVGPVTITVNATDPDGNITLVEFLDGTTVIGTSTTAPYSYTWNNPGMGDHDITVRVTDSNGGVTTSSPVTITSATSTGLYSSNANTLNGAVYPNPAVDELFVESETDLTQATIQIINMMGAIAETDIKITQNRLTIDVNGLADGAYTLVIKQNDKIFRKKFIVLN